MSNHFREVQGYSDESIKGAIRSLSRNPRTYCDGTWEAERLAERTNERARRKAKRRGKAGVQ